MILAYWLLPIAHLSLYCLFIVPLLFLYRSSHHVPLLSLYCPLIVALYCSFIVPLQSPTPVPPSSTETTLVF